MPLGLVAATLFSCNGILGNDPPYLVSGVGDSGAGNEMSGGRAGSSGGKTGVGGRTASSSGGTGIGGAVDAGAFGIGGEAGAGANPSISGGAPSAGGAASGKGGSAGAKGGAPSANGGAGTLAMGGAPPATCPATVDCAQSVCDGKSCGANGRKCINKACACPSGATRETSCSDGADNDCDGAVDCADSDCPEHTQCSSAANTRCCGGACVNTESDANNCQACGSKCASGKSCVLLSDGNGRRGHCQCAGTNSLCPGHKSSSPTIICRTETPNANLCAQEAASACPSGQVFVDVSGGPNFCHY